MTYHKQTIALVYESCAIFRSLGYSEEDCRTLEVDEAAD